MKIRSMTLGLAALMVLALAPIQFDFQTLSPVSLTAEAKPGSYGGGSRGGGGGWGGSRSGGSSFSRPAPTRAAPRPPAPVGQPTRPVAKTPQAPRPVSAAAQAQAQQASAAKLRASAATSKVQPLPKTTLTQRYGKATPSTIRANRQAVQNRYSPQQRTTIVNNYSYRDTFDPFFMYQVSMLTNIALIHSFHYHHWNEYDSARQTKLLAENANLKAELTRMELAGTTRDPNFVPKEVGDPALMKTQEAVNREFGLPAEDEGTSAVDVILAMLGIGLVAGLGYTLFLHRSEAY